MPTSRARAARGWAWRSASSWSKHTADASGFRARAKAREARSTSPCRSSQCIETSASDRAARCRRERRDARAVKVYLHTFGCRANHYDTEAVRAMVAGAGHDVVDAVADADVAVFNSSAVTS